MAVDFEKLRRDVSIVSVASQCGVKLTKDGGEWIACCPFHTEDTASFTVFNGRDGVQRFHCFGCSAKGDVVDFVKAIKGVDIKEAIRIIGGEAQGGANVAPRMVKVRDPYEGIEPVEPDGEIEAGKRVKLYNPKRAGSELQWGSFSPSMVFPYHDGDGRLLGYVLRRELPDGKKETPMVMRVRLPSGELCWSRFPFPKPRALYGLRDLRDGQVIVVEGEKCKDRLAAVSGRNVVSWPGGTEGVKHTDWTPLAGRSVVIWPDADGPGISTANGIALGLHRLGCAVRVLDVMGGATAS